MTITTLDLHFQGRPQCIAAFLLQSGSGFALVETGPTSTLPALTSALQTLGVSPSQISRVFLTHIHLDHAGAAGWWARQGAQIFVHERGARHLLDPSKLLEGARQVYGHALESLWGDILPVAEEKLTILRDGDAVSLGDTTLTAWDTPGHARHHLAFLTGSVAFTGDVAGVRLPGETYISPATAPSQFDPAAYDSSLARLLQANLATLYLTHFGPVTGVSSHLTRYRALLREATALVRENLEAPLLPFTTRQRTLATAAGVSPDRWLDYETANPSANAAAGIQLSLQPSLPDPPPAARPDP